MSKTKASSVKPTTIRSVNAFEPEQRRTFKLTRSAINELPLYDGAYTYTITRKAIKGAFKSLDAGKQTMCEISFNDGYSKDSGNYTVEQLNRGRIQVGCQIFSAAAIKVVREWAGVPAPKATKKAVKSGRGFIQFTGGSLQAAAYQAAGTQEEGTK